MPENVKRLLTSQKVERKPVLFLEVTRLKMEINILLFSYALSFAEDRHLQKFCKLISIVVVLSCLENGDVTVLRF